MNANEIQKELYRIQSDVLSIEKTITSLIKNNSTDTEYQLWCIHYAERSVNNLIIAEGHLRLAIHNISYEVQ